MLHAFQHMFHRGILLQQGVADVAASKQFYVDRGLAVAKSYGRRYVEFDTRPRRVRLGDRIAVSRDARPKLLSGGNPNGAVGNAHRKGLPTEGTARHIIT